MKDFRLLFIRSPSLVSYILAVCSHCSIQKEVGGLKGLQKPAGMEETRRLLETGCLNSQLPTLAHVTPGSPAKGMKDHNGGKVGQIIPVGEGGIQIIPDGEMKP